MEPVPLSAGLVIDWTTMPTYNTIMALFAGVGLILVVWLARQIFTDPKKVAAEGWALAFAVLGTVLTLTGLHMIFTWPLASGGFPYDNIIFGEPSLAFGVLLLGAAVFLWRKGSETFAVEDATDRVVSALRPISLIVFGLGLAAFAIAAAGMWYQLFAAPPEEPISGLLSGYPWVEATFISGLYALVGLGAVLFPFALKSKGPRQIMFIAWGLAGLAFMLFGALNYFTHIGLIINTSA